MKSNIIALNITCNEVLLNKDLVPIILYSDNVEKSVENLFKVHLDIGADLFNYIFKSFIKNGDQVDIERYLNIEISCIFYDSSNGSHVTVSKSLQDICLLNQEGYEVLFEVLVREILLKMFPGGVGLSNDSIIQILKNANSTPAPIASQVLCLLDEFGVNGENRNLLIDFFKEHFN
jgi:hypothetical protein